MPDNPNSAKTKSTTPTDASEKDVEELIPANTIKPQDDNNNNHNNYKPPKKLE